MLEHIFTTTVSETFSKEGHPVSIVINDRTPAEYWCAMLNCEKSDLHYAMSNIGSTYKLVDYFLILNRRKNN